MGLGESISGLFTGKHKYTVIIALMSLIIFGLIVWSVMLMGLLMIFSLG